MIRTFLRTAVAGWLLAAAALPAYAITPTEFYVGLLRRGAADVEMGEYQRATSPLRIAAFGLVDTIEHYQSAQVYLTIAADRLGQEAAARDAARRALAAERIERRYATLSLAPATRQAFETAAKKLLSPTESATFFNAAAAGPAPQTSMTSTTVPAKVEPPPVAPTIPDLPVEGTPKATSTSSQVSPSLPSVVPAGAAAVESRLDLAAQAIDAGRLADARRIYRSVLEGQGTLPRPVLIRAAEGLYRSRDFEGVLFAFKQIGALRSGEEPYRYYVAVALYETGAFEAARTELAGALPFIEITPDVVRDRDRIEAGGR